MRDCTACDSITLQRATNSGQRPRVVVVQRRCNHSAFNGYHWTPSDYSTVRCLGCGRFWRTKAAYTATVPDAPAGWVNMDLAAIARAVGLRPRYF